MPTHLQVRGRRVQVAQKGFRSRVLHVVTTLCDPRAFTKDDLAALYRLRWHAELDLRALKDVLGTTCYGAKPPRWDARISEGRAA
jgi:IS4 transposase